MDANKTALANADHSALIALARLGNKAAYSELVKRNQSTIRSLLRRLSRDSTLADDLSQQVFLAAWIGLSSLLSVDAFHAWLRKLAVNIWLKHYRQHNVLRDAESIDEIALPTASEAVTVRMDLDHALATLPSEERLCIVLCYHEGLSHSATAELTGLPLGTVKSRINRGNIKLRKLLAAYEKSLSTNNGDEPGE